MSATIVLVDDHPVFREGLNHLLAKEKDLRVVGEAGDGQMAIEMVLQKKPDLVVMDISMPHLDGIEATRRLLSEAPETKVVALSVHSGKQFIRDMIEAGALGYILKESIPEEMVEGIRTVLTGNVYLSKTISNALVLDYKDLVSDTQPGSDAPVFSVLYTKMYPPTITADIVPRVHLVEFMENSFLHPISLVASPAGYGKSILVSQWLEVSELKGGWVSLDEDDNDLRVFLNYILEAIQIVFPDHELATRSVLGNAKMPSLKVIARHLLNDLETLPERFNLVLDDYHNIRNAEIHDLLMELLVYPSQHMHMVLITRRDPPIALGALRSRGMLTEISVKNLRFTVAETKSFLERFLRIDINPKTAQILENKMEGWVTGLHLAALSIRNEADQERMVTGLQSSSQYVRDYLIKEVLSQVPPQYKDMLLRTAILDRFCAPLCNALSLLRSNKKDAGAETGAEGFTHWLQKAHLFVIPLDTTNQWFRYHHLFRELLLNQLKRRCATEELAALQISASEWFESRSLIDEALKHASAAEDFERAVQIIERNRQVVINADQRYLLERWLAQVPETNVQHRPALLLARAWILMHYFLFETVLQLMDQVEKMIADDPSGKELQGEIALCRGYCLFFMGEGDESLKHINRALQEIPVSYSEARAQAEMIFALLSQMVGQTTQAIQRLDDLIACNDSPEGLRKNRLLITHVFIHFISGDLHAAEMSNRKLLKAIEDDKYAYAKAWAAHLQGLIHLQRCEWASAAEYFERSVGQRFVHINRVAVDSITGLMLAYQALGREEQVQATLQILKDYVASFEAPALWDLVRSAETRLAILQGRTVSLKGWHEGGMLPPEGAMLWWLDLPSMTRSRALVAEGSPTSLAEAEKQLRMCAEVNEAHHNTFQLIGIRALQALACVKKDAKAQAFSFLEKALTLAQPGNFLLPFFELGLPMKNMLLQLKKNNAFPDFIEKLLETFGDADLETIPDAANSQSVIAHPPIASSPDHKGPQPLVEPMTNRELDVIELLAQRYQNKEIADKLFITTGTVKGHLKNIFQKLNAGNRRDAVEKAKGLGILN